MKFFNICLSFFILLSIFTICRTEDADCVYTIYVKTGSMLFAGTDSKISLTLYDAKGSGIQLPDLEKWGGLMGPGYDYFESGTVDMFTGKGRCLNGSLCAMNLTSDGSGHLSSWYCSYIAVTTTGDHRKCAEKKFTVEQWLSNIWPLQLSATRNDCSSHYNERITDSHDSSQVSDINKRMIDGYDSSQISDVDKRIVDNHDLSKVFDILQL